MIYMFLANGFEETEAVATLDVLLRAEIQVKTVGIGSKAVMGSHGITVTADIEEKDVRLDGSYQGVVLPGGMQGMLNLSKNATVKKALETAAKESLLLAAICAAPIIPGKMGLFKGKKVTCYPGCEDKLEGAIYTSAPVCVDGNVITGWGPGASVRFGLAIAEYLCGREKAASVEASFKCAL